MLYTVVYIPVITGILSMNKTIIS